MSEITAAVVMSGTAQLMATAVAWGMYALLFSISVFLVIKKGIRNCAPRQILLFSTCLMFAASTALASVDTAIYLVQFFAGDYIAASNKLQLACEVLFDSLFLMGDTIVLWRTWTLCPDQKVLVLGPITLWFGGFTCLMSLIGIAVQNGTSSAWTIGVYDASTTLRLSMATAALSAATNFFSTLLISGKAWQRRDLFTAPHLSTNGPGTKTHKILSLLIESGFLYFAIWIIAMLNFYLDWKAPLLQAILRGAYDMVMGTYPTVIIILVHMDYTFWDSTNGSTTINSSTRMFSTIPPSIGSFANLSPDTEKKMRL
ncbi:hypothetical protein MSAN_01597200 [Mycena sanguinolenta]|uniref:Uncharacterized protein n=1 Tax=Mycena sanguinolenta TaxID=230812 RepID=A0A8H6Y3R6_9AGAR|nr:hypothetical protein MSAN_01597200 [Mycena sanguinolenta]